MGFEALSRVEEGQRNDIIDGLLERISALSGSKSETVRTVEIGRKELEEVFEQGVTMEQILDRLAGRGFVLHGSSFDLQTVEPKTAQGVHEYERQTAIYATDLAPVAMFNALTPKAANLDESFHTCWDGNADASRRIKWIRFGASKNALEHLRSGFVYVFDGSKFTPDHGDFICKESCQPDFKIPISREDFSRPIEECETGSHDHAGNLLDRK